MMNLGALSWRNTPWIKATRPQWRYALRNGIAMCLALTVAYYVGMAGAVYLGLRPFYQ